MSVNSEILSPEREPAIVKKGNGVGVRRVNNLPIVIFGAIMLVFMLLMMIVAMNRAHDRNLHPIDDNKDVQSSQSYASLIAKDYVGGFIEPKGPPVTSTQSESAQLAIPGLIIERPSDLDRPPMPPGAQSSHSVQDPDLAHIRMLKRQQLEEAIKAKTQVNVVAPRSSASAPSVAPKTRDEMLAEMASVRHQINSTLREDPTTAYQTRLVQLRARTSNNAADGVAGVGGTDVSASESLAEANRDPHRDDHGDEGGGRLLNEEGEHPTQDYSRFDSQRGQNRWRLDSDVQKPASPYVLQAGFVIPATLISGINSSLSGQIMAQVSQHIYDSPAGHYRLIPQGSRLVGTYSSEVEFGQARVLVAWQRIIFPDGKTMDIGAMPGADGVGRAGFNDQVNNHYLRIFGSALVMSAIVAGAAYSQRDSGGAFGRQNAGSIMSQSLGQQLGLVTTNLIRKNLNIAPTLEIRPGYRFNLIVTKDLKFSTPYQSFNY